MKNFRSSILALTLLVSLAASALPQVDITLVQNGSNIDVKVRPDADFDGLFSSLLFTIRWNAADGANLDTESQVAPWSACIPTAKAGPEQDDAGYRYQIFAGFGFSTLATQGTSWVAGVEYTILTVPVINGASNFEVINDSWTADIGNNGDYYVSLNGQDQTGSIYMGPNGVVNVAGGGMAVNVLPNPTDGLAELKLDVPVASDVRMELNNAAGQAVWTKQLKDFSGTLREELDLRPYGKGVYLLNVTVGASKLTRRIVVK